MGEAFEEGQGPHRAVEPVVMMIMGADFKNFREYSGLRHKFSRQTVSKDSKAADDKGWHQNKGTNGVELQGVHSPLPLLNSKNILSQNKIDYIHLNRLHYLSKMRRREASWKTFNIQQKIFRH
jgi:hypothetical protein